MLHTTNRLSQKTVALLPVIAVLLGIAIYVLARPDEPVALHWARSQGLGNFLEALRPKSANLVNTLPAWIVYSLPNALWALSYTILITRIWARDRVFIGYLWMATIPALVLGIELLQYMEILRGTFSITDLVAGILGMVAGFIIGIRFKK